MAEYGVILVTADSQETASAIAKALVTKRLAACVNLFPIHSVYRWQGTIQQDSEWQLIIKTDLGQAAAIESTLNEIHPYDVPEMIALAICYGAKPYLSWLGKQVGAPPN